MQQKLAEEIAEGFRRNLDVRRIQGWTFPATCDVAVTITDEGSSGVLARIRADDISAEMFVEHDQREEDIQTAADMLTSLWLGKYGKKKKKLPKAQEGDV